MTAVFKYRIFAIDLSEKSWRRPGSNPRPIGLGEILTVRPAKTVKKLAERSEAWCKKELKWL